MTTTEPLDQASIATLSRALEKREVSAVEIARHHLDRVERLDEAFNAVIELNPDALEIAARCDAAREPLGPLHGIPVMVKDNIDTGDQMETTAGSLALAGTRAGEDAALVRRLREAGAVLLGKTNLSEWANFRSTRSSSGWSSRGGQTRNAYDRSRTPGGSSSGSGVAVALGLTTVAVGTETDGSVVGPSAMNGVVGIKPTLGLVSRAGIIPIAASQDTAGPMARSVADAAVLLSVMIGEDANDRTTAGAGTRALAGSFDEDALSGARIGVARTYAGYHDAVDRLFEEALAALRDLGAVVVDPVELTPADSVRPAERLVMETEFRHGLDCYLAAREPSPPVTDLAALIRFNLANADATMPHFRQELLERALARGALDDPAYLAARERSLRLAGAEGIDLALGEHRLDAIVAPSNAPAWLIDWIAGDNRSGGCSCLPAVAGYPHVTVPMGFVQHLPVGLSFFAGAHADARVIALAHAFERHTGHRRGPSL